MSEEVKLTDEEIAAFKGLDDSYVEMERRISEVAPTCHFRKMFLDECEGESWWECSVCGHTKDYSAAFK